MIERMARYQRTYGLDAIGPHRPLADKVFRGLRQSCTNCGGSGFVGTHDWLYCPICEGSGGFWCAPERELIGAYRYVLAAFPDAARPGALDPCGAPDVGEDVRQDE